MSVPPPPPTSLSGISRLLVDLPFLSPLLLFCLVLWLILSCNFVVVADGPFSFLPENVQTFFGKIWAFLYGSC